MPSDTKYFRPAQGRLAEAELRHRRALVIREKALGSEHPGVATGLNNLAEYFHNQVKVMMNVFGEKRERVDVLMRPYATVVAWCTSSKFTQHTARCRLWKCRKLTMLCHPSADVNTMYRAAQVLEGVASDLMLLT